MTLLNVNSSVREYNIQVRYIFPAVADDGETGLITFLNSDGTTFTVDILSGASNQATGDNNLAALESTPAFNEKYTVVDNGGGNLHVTQIQNDGPFLITISELTGSLSVSSQDVTPSEFTPPRHRLFLVSPQAGAVGDRYMSRMTQRGRPGFYRLPVVADTNALTPSIVVEDSNDLLAPSPGPSTAGQKSGFMDTGEITLNHGPDWAREALQNEAVTPKEVRLEDEDYTVLPGDSIITVSTAGTGDATLTFATGTPWQRVTVLMIARVTDDYIVSGVEGFSTVMQTVNDTLEVIYDSVGDKWYVTSDEVVVP